jgi:hypothetical protein
MALRGTLFQIRAEREWNYTREYDREQSLVGDFRKPMKTAPV